MNRNTLEMIARLQKEGVTLDEALALRRISMTLQRWHELECGDSNNYGSWAIERDDNGDGPPFMVYHTHQGNFGWAVWCREDRKSNGEPGNMVRATRPKRNNLTLTHLHTSS